MILEQFSEKEHIGDNIQMVGVKFVSAKFTCLKYSLQIYMLMLFTGRPIKFRIMWK